MPTPSTAFRPPDLSARPHALSAERVLAAPPAAVYRAWMKELDRWFADPGSVLAMGEVDTVCFFETVQRFEKETRTQRHPHYGRFLRLERDRLVELTWMTSGTQGAETVVTVELSPHGTGTHLRLAHAGFPDTESRDGHARAWPTVLEQLDAQLSHHE
jgi:uncharacterized protein YndB with AHSA1/START domain